MMAHRASKDSVAKQFVRLYYSILNMHHEHLHQFYGKSSTVVVSEMLEGGETMTETAEDEESCRELLKWLYEDVTIKVESAVPQFSVEGSVLLLVNGTMFRKSQKDERLFTQALLLAPQDNGFYIRTDTLHVLNHGPTASSGADLQSPFVYDDKEVSGCESPKTPRAEAAEQGFRLGRRSTRNSVDEAPSHAALSREMQTATPPPHENALDTSKSSGSEGDHEEFRSGPYFQRSASQDGHSQVVRQTIPPPMHSLPPVMMPSMAMLPHPAMGTMAMNLGMGPAQSGLRRRSMSMSGDVRTLQPTSGFGVFIARLPFGIQARDVAEAFQEFGPIVGGVDGIQVRDGRNGCYAFVNFATSVASEAAIQKGATVQGKRVYVEPRYQRPEAEMVIPVPVVAHARPPMPLPRRAN